MAVPHGAPRSHAPRAQNALPLVPLNKKLLPSLEDAKRAVALLTHRTQAGEDRYDEDFEPYSTRPFAMPAGGTKRKRDALGELDTDYFQRSGSLWAVVEGGYAAYKKKRHQNSPGGGETVNLTATGGMLGALSVTDVQTCATDGSVTVGFSRLEAAEKAYYHSVAELVDDAVTIEV